MKYVYAVTGPTPTGKERAVQFVILVCYLGSAIAVHFYGASHLLLWIALLASFLITAVRPLARFRLEYGSDHKLELALIKTSRFGAKQLDFIEKVSLHDNKLILDGSSKSKPRSIIVDASTFNVTALQFISEVLNGERATPNQWKERYSALFEESSASENQYITVVSFCVNKPGRSILVDFGLLFAVFGVYALLRYFSP